MPSLGHFEGAPGADLIASGLEDLAADRETVAALLVCMASTRLRSIGLDVPSVTVERPSHRLYDLLAQDDARTAHSRFNALTRRLASFARAAEHARAR
ncbi:MAG: hypothetical protein ACR2ML_10235 [Solirubrobacteraceae bacterium]